jgi:small conductance mechanosensitive channel
MANNLVDWMAPMPKEIEEVGKWVDVVTEFGVTYGFQILGALVFLLIGLKVASLVGGKVSGIAEAKNIDPTLSRFFGSIVKLLIIIILVIITLGNFGISIAPLIALAGASAFGATLAIQGPLSNYGAGLTIILTRPFKVGSTITVRGVGGVVEDINLGFTLLLGEDGEQITIPNKEIVGQTHRQFTPTSNCRNKDLPPQRRRCGQSHRSA